MRTISRLLGGSTLVVVTACGGGGTGPGNGGGGNCSGNTFCMTASAFTPVSRSVAVNTPVTWTNSSVVEHNVTFDTPGAAGGVAGGASGNFDSPTTSSNRRQFAAVGSYPFHCTIHGTGMSGTVVVQ